MTDRIDLDELESLARGATPGPWCQHPNGTSVWEGPDWDTVNYEKARVKQHRHVCNATAVDEIACYDMAFVAGASPSVVLALIAELRAHRERELSGGWVACSERLPENMQDIYFVLSGKVRAGYYDGYWNEKDGYWEPQQASHWMPRFVPPLPSPPETT